MEDVKIIRPDAVEPTLLPATRGKEAGWLKRIVFPPNVDTKGAFFGVAEVNPTYSVHRWHSHVRDKAEGYEVVYPENFEEVYYIISGTGVVQWKTDGGKVKEENVSAGDTMFFPIGVAEHQLVNTSDEKMFVAFFGTPLHKVTLT
jgi:mannose-6-phosphate isomerase-like protein (cupin superfamily)